MRFLKTKENERRSSRSSFLCLRISIAIRDRGRIAEHIVFIGLSPIKCEEDLSQVSKALIDRDETGHCPDFSPP